MTTDTSTQRDATLPSPFFHVANLALLMPTVAIWVQL